MIKEVIGIGDTEVDALSDAKKKLGLDDSADVEFEIIQRAEKKKFGLFGGAQAQVKVTLKATPAETAEEYLRAILDGMNLSNVTISTKEIEGGVEFDLEGENVGYVIGRRGETLDALQYLTSLVANHTDNAYYKITINTGNYREKRENTLEILGRKLAFKALKTGRKQNLEPMNPYERRIIHTAVQKVNGAISWSEGENTNRHVVIGPDPKVKSFHRNNYNSRGGYNKDYNKGGYNRNRKPYENHSVASTPSPDRKPINEGGESGGLYGRIDK